MVSINYITKWKKIPSTKDNQEYILKIFDILEEILYLQGGTSGIFPWWNNFYTSVS